MLAATAALALASGGAVGGLAYSWWNAPADAPYGYLSTQEAGFLVALSAAIFPPGGAPAFSGADLDADRFVDEVMGSMPEFQQHGLKLLMHALDNAAKLSDLKAFQNLERDRAEELFWTWLSGPVAEQRSAVQSLALLVGMAYTTHPEVAPFFAPWWGCGYGR